MNIREQLVTPDLAYKFLEGNTHNRTLRQSVVERYARDMAAGKWQLTHEAIAFDFNKVLIDGQHRLWAVIESKTPVKFHVAYDVRPETRGVIGAPVIRDVKDQLNLGHDLHVTKMASGIAKRLLRDRIQGKATTAEVFAAIAVHKKAIEFAEKCFTRVVRGVTTVPVLSVFARAYYHAETDALRHFGEVLQDGRVTDASDDVILLLRNFLLERAPRSGGEPTIYAKAERALFAYLHNQRVSTLYPAPNEMFPLPEEQTGKRRIHQDNSLKTLTVGKKLSAAKRKKKVV